MPATSRPRAPESEAPDGPPRLQPDELIRRARAEITAGREWFDALLDVIAAWTLPAEEFGGQHLRYLVGGEAFDWLLLAQRLTEDLGDLIPSREREALLFFGRPPGEAGEDDLRERFGHRKYRAHLNYFYGVVVEEALQLAVEEEVQKNRHAGVWSDIGEEIFERIYGKPRAELWARYTKQTHARNAEQLSISELQQFTYWLFKFRLNRSDPAKVASDTRKGLAQLSRMELARRNRPEHVESTPEDVIDI
jgi:hypothetical protein